MKNLNRHLMETEKNQTQNLGEKKMKAKILILGLVALSILSFAASVSAGVPQMINYQGVLTDSEGCPEDGNFNMFFRIYADSADGPKLWEYFLNQVPVTKGNFNVLLAIPGSLFVDTTEFWLAVQVGNDPEMTPRQRITSVGYAFKATHSDTAQYAHAAPLARPISPPVESSEVADNAVTSSKILDSTISSDDVALNFKAPYADTADYAQNAELASYSDTSGYDLSGPPDGDWDYWTNPPHMFSIPTDNVGIGTTSPQRKLHIADTPYPQVRIENTDADGKIFELGTSADPAGGFGLSDISKGTRPFFIESGAQDTLLYLKENYVGIRTSDPSYHLDVNEDLRVRDDLFVEDYARVHRALYIYETGSHIAGWTLYVDGGAKINDSLRVLGTIKLTYDYDTTFSISAGSEVTVTHGLGGEEEEYFVFLYGKNTYGIHQMNYGTACQRISLEDRWFGCAWYKLNNNTITIRRATDDNNDSWIPVSKQWDQVILRILRNQ